jgi:hypothetical protein
MDLEPITGAPKTGEFVIVFDETRGEYDVARWSKQDAAWVNEGGEAIAITPTHWKQLRENAPIVAAAPAMAAPANAPRQPRTRRFPYRRGIVAAAILLVAVSSGLVLARAMPADFVGLLEKSRLFLAELAGPGQISAAQGEASAQPAVSPPEGEAQQPLKEQRTERIEKTASTAMPRATEPTATDQALGEEREKTAALDRALTLARQDIERLKEQGAASAAMVRAKSAAETAAADQALVNEREKTAALDRALALARQEIERLKEQSAATEETTKRERQRAATLTRQLQAARKELQALKERRPTGNGAGGPDTGAEGDQNATPDPAVRRPRGRSQLNATRPREALAERPQDEPRTNQRSSATAPDRRPFVWPWLVESID